MRAFFLALIFTAASCSSGNAPTMMVRKDMGSGLAICPDHPENCQGKCCGSNCTDTTIDANNCGTCGNKCPAGLVCKAGVCGCLPSGVACGMGQSCCPNTGCHSLDSDVNNCGGCGSMFACGTGAKCMSGKCVCGGITCAAGQSCCNGVCASTCMSSSMPDMAMGSSSNMPLCDCTGLALTSNPLNPSAPPDQCPVSHMCVQKDCCAEDIPLAGLGIPGIPPCNDPTPCQTSLTPQ
jgi:hypothetical protein